MMLVGRSIMLPAWRAWKEYMTEDQETVESFMAHATGATRGLLAIGAFLWVSGAVMAASSLLSIVRPLVGN